MQDTFGHARASKGGREIRENSPNKASAFEQSLTKLGHLWQDMVSWLFLRAPKIVEEIMFRKLTLFDKSGGFGLPA